MRKRGFKKSIVTMATVFCMVMSAPVNALAAGVVVQGETKTVESVTTTDDEGVRIDAGENERTVLHVKKGVTVDSKSEGRVDGMGVCAYGKNAYAEAVVEQDVNVHASNASPLLGIDYEASNGGETCINVNNIYVNNESSENVNNSILEGVTVNGKSKVNINGNVRLDAASGNSTVIYSEARTAGSSEINLAGDVFANGRIVEGLSLKNFDSESGKIDNAVYCKGSLTLTGGQFTMGINNKLECGSVYTGVDGNVISNGEYAYGACAFMYGEDNDATVEVGGNTKVTGTVNANGFDTWYNSVGEKNVRLNVKGDVSVNSAYGYAGGVSAWFSDEKDSCEGKKTFAAVVDGNLSVEGEYAQAVIVYGEDANADVYLRTGGNLTGTTEGISLWNVAGSKADFLIEGTLSATNGPAVTLGENASDGYSIAAWRVASGEDYDLVMEASSVDPEDAEYTHTAVSKKAEKNINYLIKVAPEQKEYFVFDEGIQKTWGELADEEITYPCAHEGEKVVVKVQNIPEGYVVSKVYADAEKTLLMAKEGEDTYSVIMPKGGGVTVNMELEPAPILDVNVLYSSHVQSAGWEMGVKRNGAVSGTMGEGKRLEAIIINVNGNEDLGIQYTTHVQGYGWMNWSSNGEVSGTTGESKRIEAVKIQLTGKDKDKYDVYYRVHAQGYGWLNWASNGKPAGTAGLSKRLEAFQVVVVKKGEEAPANLGSITSVNEQAYISAGGFQPVIGAADTDANAPEIAGAERVNVAYRTHIQTYGWQNWKANGQTSGTTGESKRLEAISLKLSNKDYAGGIRYKTHVQTYGWQDFVADGKVSGTSGQSKRLEAICIELTGEMAEHYDVYYRVHSQTYGWLGWASNGAPAGTEGLSKRLEGIEIVLVEKGGAAPGNTENAFVK